MRFALLAVVLPAVALPAAAKVAVSVHSARPFGYFVGDLMNAHIDVAAPENAVLSTASLPRPGPLSISLDLRDVAVGETMEGGKKLWRIDLVYQNFYVALDVRNIEIPGFELSIATPAGAETISVPAWSVGVAPLREIAPAQKERAEDYMRPDAPAALVGEARPRNLALAFGALTCLLLLAVAWDRGWPPLQRRRARIFAGLARRLAARRPPREGDAFAGALQSVHRAIDAANGASLLAEDLPGFFTRRPEFAALAPSFDRFFAMSHKNFFGGGASPDDGYDLAELIRFVKDLARRERAR